MEHCPRVFQASARRKYSGCHGSRATSGVSRSRTCRGTDRRDGPRRFKQPNSTEQKPWTGSTTSSSSRPIPTRSRSSSPRCSTSRRAGAWGSANRLRRRSSARLATPTGLSTWTASCRGAATAAAGVSSSARRSPDSSRSSKLTYRRSGPWRWAPGTSSSAHERCIERGLPCTDIHAFPWGREGGGITFFFVEVGGIVFEIMRIEATAPA